MSRIEDRMSAAADYANKLQQRMQETEELRKEDREKAEKSKEAIREMNNNIATRSKELRKEEREELQYRSRQAARAQEPGKGLNLDEMA